MKAWEKGALAGAILGAVWGLLWMFIVARIVVGNAFIVPKPVAETLLFPITLTARLNKLFRFHPDSLQVMCIFPTIIGAMTLAATGALIGELASRRHTKERKYI